MASVPGNTQSYRGLNYCRQPRLATLHRSLPRLPPRQATGLLVRKVLECAMPEVTAHRSTANTVRPRAMVLVLFASLFLCLIAGLGLALGWFSLPSLPRCGPNVLTQQT